MKAVRMTAVGRPLELHHVEPREPGEGALLVRVRAAGICHSDAHYRRGLSPMGPLPLTLGHEIAGVVERVGPGVRKHKVGDRVCLHYLVTCGICDACRDGHLFLCGTCAMLGHHVDGGFAEFVTVPATSAVPLPIAISFEHGAVMMCSSATALHALQRGRLDRFDDVAIFGCGGLGVSAIQLAIAFGAEKVYGVDVRPDRLALASKLGAIAIDASVLGADEQILGARRGAGVDVAIDFVGRSAVTRQALRSVGEGGRLVLVALSDERLELDPYREILGPERELIGSNDHTIEEIKQLIPLALERRLDLSHAVTGRVPLDAAAINGVLDALDENRAGVRTVVVP